MLNKITLHGMQSHLDTELIFIQGSNLILGDNGSGKSAIRRGLTWVTENKPTGTSFINWDLLDSDVCEVSVSFNDHVVTRRRSRDSKVNEYIIDGGDPLTAFGVSVPQPVQEIFQLDDTNLEMQHSALFMLTESPPNIARRLNKLTNLESIDKAYSSIRSKKLEVSKKIKGAQAEFKKREVSIAELSFIPLAEKVIIKAEAAEKIANEFLVIYNTSLELKNNLEKTLTEIMPHSNISEESIEEALANVTSCGHAFKEVAEIYEILDSLKINEHAPVLIDNVTALQGKAERLQTNYTNTDNAITALQNVSTIIYAPIKSKDLSASKLVEYTTTLAAIKFILNELNATTEAIITTKEKRDNVKTLFDATMPDECPLCGNISKGGQH